MSNKRTAVVVGQKVRVKRAEYHGIRFGAVCEVVSADYWLGDVVVRGPMDPNWATYGPDAGPEIDTQFVELEHILHAPQANRKG